MAKVRRWFNYFQENPFSHWLQTLLFFCLNSCITDLSSRIICIKKFQKSFFPSFHTFNIFFKSFVIYFFLYIMISISFHYSWFTVFCQFSTVQHGDPVTHTSIHFFFLTLSCSIIGDLRKLYIELPYDPATPLLGIYLEKTLLECSTIHSSQNCLLNQVKSFQNGTFILSLVFTYVIAFISALYFFI